MDSQSIQLWLRTRQLPLVLTILAALAIIGALWGLQVVPIPQPAGLGGMVTLLWYHPMLAACAIATTLNSPMPDQETIGSVRLDLWNRLLITVLALVDSLLLMAVAAIGGSTHSNHQLIGGLLYWLALALVSARILGPGRFWALPLLAGAARFTVGVGVSLVNRHRLRWRR
jgi:hypothetical protein